MKKVLVTGAGGQLGQSLDLQNVTTIRTSRSKSDSIDVILDVTDNQNVESLINEHDPDIILHLAAMTNVDGCELNPDKAHEINVKGTANLLKLFDGKFIFLSTDYVFNGEDGPYSENDEVDPINVYGRSKLDAENIVKEISNDWVILRTNVVWNIGGSYHASFADWLVNELTNERTVKIVTDQWNNPTHTDDLGRVIDQIIEKDAQGLFHYGSSDVLNRYDFAKLIANVYELDESLITPIRTESLNQSAKRPLKSGLKTDKIEQELEIMPSDLWEDIERTLNQK